MSMSDLPRRRRQHGQPIHIDRVGVDGTAQRLEPISLFGNHADAHDEGWLQNLLFRFPQSLPAAEIDIGYGSLVPVCLELPTPVGFVDLLYVTVDGGIVLVECKLWRNPQARREVVAQIIDYARSMASWSYTDLELAVARASRPAAEPARGRLYDYVSADTTLSEPDFVDAVERNLRLGRLMLLVVGDGIRLGAETLGDFLQLHPGFHFALSLIETPIYTLPAGGFVMVPRVLARTVNIERGIVRIADDRVRVEPIISPATGAPVARRTTPTLERGLELLDANTPGLSEKLRRLSDVMSPLGVVLTPAGQSVMLKWLAPTGRRFTLAAIGFGGEFSTDTVGWEANAIGRVDLAHDYLASLATLLGGSVGRTPKPENWYVVVAGKPPRASDVLDRADAIGNIAEAYITALGKALDSSSG